MDTLERSRRIMFLLTKGFSELVIIFGAVSFGFMIAINDFSDMWRIIILIFFAVVAKVWAEYNLFKK